MPGLKLGRPRLTQTARFKKHMNVYLQSIWAMFVKKMTFGKALLLASGFTSSTFVGFWMATTMPAAMPFWLGVTVAIVAAAVLDGIVVYTAFSPDQGYWNWLTVAVALVGSVAVTLALFMNFYAPQLHVIFAILGFVFSRFMASENSGTGLVALSTPESRDQLISQLILANLDNEAIFTIVKGNRAKSLARIKEIRDGLA